MTNIHNDLTPYSAFPTSAHESYASYILEKYGQETVHRHQFMLETKGITQNLKLLTPGDGYADSGSLNEPYLLIPEFCHNFEFPAELWLKATLIPSILHRLNYLLIAEKLRVKINRAVSISSDNYIPAPVIVKMKLTPIEINSTLANSELSTSDFRSLTDETLWKQIEEPIDYHRNISTIIPVELDYFHNFISEKMVKLCLTDQATFIRKTYNTKCDTIAICDVVDTEVFKIDALEITSYSPTMGPQQCDLLAAITVASSADVFNMERFEVIGDSYLKFAVSLFLMQKHRSWHEGLLTACKSKIVSNRNLLYRGMEHNIGGMLNVHGFNPNGNWSPPLMSPPKDVLVSDIFYKKLENA